MSRVGLLEQLYSVISLMTVANGYHYDYTAYKVDMDVDNGTLIEKDALKPKIAIVFGDETNIDSFDGYTTGEYQDTAPVTIQVSIQTGDVEVYEWSYEQQLVKAKVIDDVKRRFNSPYIFSDNSVKNWQYTGEGNEPLTPKQDLYGMMAYLNFEITYTTDRAINNN